MSLPLNFSFGFGMMYLRKVPDVRPSIALCGFSILKQKTHSASGNDTLLIDHFTLYQMTCINPINFFTAPKTNMFAFKKMLERLFYFEMVRSF